MTRVEGTSDAAAPSTAPQPAAIARLRRFSAAVLTTSFLVTVTVLAMLLLNATGAVHPADSAIGSKLVTLETIASLPTASVFTALIGIVGLLAVSDVEGWRLGFATGVAGTAAVALTGILYTAGVFYPHTIAVSNVILALVVASASIALACLCRRCATCPPPVAARQPEPHVTPLRIAVLTLGVSMLVAALHGAIMLDGYRSALRDPLSSVHEGGLTALGWGIHVAIGAACATLAVPGLASVAAGARPTWWRAPYWISYAGLWAIALLNIVALLGFSPSIMPATPLLSAVSYACMTLPVALVVLARRLGYTQAGW